MTQMIAVPSQESLREAWSTDGISERYIVPAAQAMRREMIQKMTDCGAWLEQAEYMMDTLFACDALSFEAFLERHADIARVLWPVRR